MEIDLGFPWTGGQPVRDRMRESPVRPARDDVPGRHPRGRVGDEIRRRSEGLARPPAALEGTVPAVEGTMPALAGAPPRLRREEGR